MSDRRAQRSRPTQSPILQSGWDYGPINTAEERAKLSADVEAWLTKIEKMRGFRLRPDGEFEGNESKAILERSREDGLRRLAVRGVRI